MFPCQLCGVTLAIKSEVLKGEICGACQIGMVEEVPEVMVPAPDLNQLLKILTDKCFFRENEDTKG